MYYKLFSFNYSSKKKRIFSVNPFFLPNALLKYITQMNTMWLNKEGKKNCMKYKIKRKFCCTTEVYV